MQKELREKRGALFIVRTIRILQKNRKFLLTSGANFGMIYRSQHGEMAELV